ncbi:unnamed protein product [Mytilus edulis]|uniref:PH domain-containing protein n=1 Tax=Mytilus edulis TaxID=6550 RepID=A0A8S3QGE9_MYTED|nr:unnamed protein product [Mytilus edulis]
MACCGPNAIRIKKPTEPVVKTGYLKIYEKGCICKGWKSRYFVLYQDSSLIWYPDDSSYQHSGGVKLKMVANYMAVGPMCLHITGRPELPKGRLAIHMMGIPNIFKKGTKKLNIVMNWILFDGGDDEMKAWLDVIKPTLPPPPPRPKRPPHSHHAKQKGHSKKNGHPRKNGQPPPYRFNSNVVNPAKTNPAYPPTNNGYSPNRQTRQKGQEGGHRTVVVQNGGGGHRDNNDFATGIILRGALGNGLSKYGPGYGWGYGWGWGPHPYGGYWGSWSSFGSHGGDMNIDNNYYDCDHENEDYGYDDNDVGDFEEERMGMVETLVGAVMMGTMGGGGYGGDDGGNEGDGSNEGDGAMKVTGVVILVGMVAVVMVVMAVDVEGDAEVVEDRCSLCCAKHLKDFILKQF